MYCCVLIQRSGVHLWGLSTEPEPRQQFGLVFHNPTTWSGRQYFGCRTLYEDNLGSWTLIGLKLIWGVFGRRYSERIQTPLLTSLFTGRHDGGPKEFDHPSTTPWSLPVRVAYVQCERSRFAHFCVLTLCCCLLFRPTVCGCVLVGYSGSWLLGEIFGDICSLCVVSSFRFVISLFLFQQLCVYGIAGSCKPICGRYLALTVRSHGYAHLVTWPPLYSWSFAFLSKIVNAIFRPPDR